jgi:NADH dehydrogenase FAD-containing subunit
MTERGSVFVGRSGMVRVRDTLQMYGAENILIAGDAALVDHELDLWHDGGRDGEKTAYAALEAGRVAAENAIRILRRCSDSEKPVSSLLRYPEDAFPGRAFPRLFTVSLGQWDGILSVGPVVIGGILAAATKYTVETLIMSSVRRGGIATQTMSFLEGVGFRMATTFAWLARRRQRHFARHPAVAP